MKERRLVYYTERKKIKEQTDSWGLCCWWERCVTFRGRNHRAVGASMWLLSHWRNVDQVVQWTKSRSCKKLIREKVHFTGRNKVSLCGLRAQAVFFPLQMWAALWGSLCLCKCERWSWLSILAFIRAEQREGQNQHNTTVWRSSFMTCFTEMCSSSHIISGF